MVQNVKLTDLQRRASIGIAAATDLIWPPSCPLCNDSPPAFRGNSTEFCSCCAAALSESEALAQSACRRCGVPLPQASLNPENSDSRAYGETLKPEAETHAQTQNVKTRAALRPDKSESATNTRSGESANQSLWCPPSKCLHCHNQNFKFKTILPLWLYRGRVREAVLAAKNAHQTALGATLGRRLGTRVREVQGRSCEFDLVTFVPSHFTRQFSRGGNGNQVIAKEVGRTLGVTCQTPLKITRRISKQAWLGDQARIGNVSGAFSLKKSYAWGRSFELTGKRILLIDDVMTTGATANEISRVLLAAGARGVCLAVVARAIRS